MFPSGTLTLPSPMQYFLHIGPLSAVKAKPMSYPNTDAMARDPESTDTTVRRTSATGIQASRATLSGDRCTSRPAVPSVGFKARTSGVGRQPPPMAALPALLRSALRSQSLQFVVSCRAAGIGLPPSTAFHPSRNAHSFVGHRSPRAHAHGCERKKRIISADASGPRASVYEPAALPPDHACAAPCNTHTSATTRSAASA